MNTQCNKKLENPGGGARGRETPLPLLLPPQPLLLPLEAGETEGGGTEVAEGAHQDVVGGPPCRGGGPPRHGRGGPPPMSLRGGGANGSFNYGTRLALLIHKIAILRVVSF